MSESVNNTQNLNSYYTIATKVEKPKHVVVSAPDKMPSQHVFDDKEANAKLKNLNTNIYIDTKKEKKNSEGRVMDYIIGAGAVILGIIGVKYIIKFFRKS